MILLKRWLRSGSLALLLFLFVASVTAAQSSPVNIKIEAVDSKAFPKVKAFLSVSDSQGFPITGLDKSSFKITEDDKPIDGFQVSPFKNTDQPLAIVLVMDTSGSMVGKPLADSVAAAKSFMAQLMPNDPLAVVSFADKVKVAQDLTTDRGKVTQALEQLKSEGNTALYDSIVEAVGLLKNRSERRVLVLLTDGRQAGPSQFDFDQAVNEASRWSVPIYPIGFGGVNRDELGRLAKLTGGAAQVNPDSSSLAPAFQNVLNQLREQYLLEFDSTLKADGIEHNFSVSVAYQNGFASTARKYTAFPGQVSLAFPDITDGQTLGGKILFKPEVLSPAPLARLDGSLDGQSLTSVLAAPYEFVWDSTTVSPGDHLLEWKATDLAGNSGSMKVTLKIRPPIVITPGFSQDQVVSGKIKASAAVDSLAAIAKIQFLLDGQSFGEAVSSPYEIDWDTTRVVPGFHSVLIRAVDVNGLSSEATVRVNVEMQNSSNLLWIALIVVLAAAAIIIPLAVRRNAKSKQAKSQPSVNGLVRAKASLIEKEGISPGQVWPLTADEVRLGRKRDENDIPLKGLKASRCHAIIRFEAEGYTLYSLNPENPTMLNGNPNSSQFLLHSGDRIQAGESIFIFEVQES
jgi:VWFA-related protein